MTDASEKEDKVKESVERAKEAVALDVKDGTSWSKSANSLALLSLNIEEGPAGVYVSFYCNTRNDRLFLCDDLYQIEIVCAISCLVSRPSGSGLETRL